MCPNVSRLQWVVFFRDAWSPGGFNVFLLVLILLSTSIVLLRSTYLTWVHGLARYYYIITPNVFVHYYSASCRLGSASLSLSFSADGKFMLWMPIQGIQAYRLAEPGQPKQQTAPNRRFHGTITNHPTPFSILPQSSTAYSPFLLLR